MDEKIINELLLQLEQSLKNIESAREQVKKTVNAYEALEKDVKHYTEELSFIVQNTRTMISQLEGIKEKFLGNISANIIEEIKAGVRKITEKTDALSPEISSVYKLTDSNSKTIIRNINSRSNSIDMALGAIQNTIDSLSRNIDSVITKLDTLTSSLDTLTLNEDKHFKEIEKKLDEQEKSICRELSVIRKQNLILFAVNVLLLLVILGFILHMSRVL